jgi:hypothetical protein
MEYYDASNFNYAEDENKKNDWDAYGDEEEEEKEMKFDPCLWGPSQDVVIKKEDNLETYLDSKSEGLGMEVDNLGLFKGSDNETMKVGGKRKKAIAKKGRKKKDLEAASKEIPLVGGAQFKNKKKKDPDGENRLISQLDALHEKENAHNSDKHTQPTSNVFQNFF